MSCAGPDAIKQSLTVFFVVDSIGVIAPPHFPMRRPFSHRLAISLVAAISLFPAVSGRAEADREVRAALASLRSDHKKHNCGEGIELLYPRREELKDALVDELYRTDAQGQAAILFILYNTKSFTPDERFLRLVMQQLPADQKAAAHGSGCDLPITVRDDGELNEIVSRWEYVDAHFDLFEPLLTAQISTTKDSWMLWATAWLFKKRGIFETKMDLFTTPEVLGVAAANLARDNVNWNASGAIRLFLILGERSVPALRTATRSSDSQTKYLAKATLDALKGERRAFGYLGSKVNLSETLFGPGVVEPEWMYEVVSEYLDRDVYP